MKCNHCKKVIPNQEELKHHNLYFHEECLEEWNKDLDKGAREFVVGIVIAFAVAFIIAWLIQKKKKKQDK